MIRVVRRMVLTAACVAMSLLVAAPAWAHVTVVPAEMAASGYAKLDFRVPHGCESAATEVVAVQLPDGIVSVTPQVVPGWEITTEIGPLSEPVELHGETITEGVRVVTWTGGPLDTSHLEEFGMSVRVEGSAGDTLYFPTVQYCVDGSEAAWIQIPTSDDEELDYPAPSVVLAAASEGHGHDSDDAADDDTATDDPAVETTEAPVDSAAGDTGTDSGTSPVAWVGLVLGAVGAVLGGAAFASTRRKA